MNPIQLSVQSQQCLFKPNTGILYSGPFNLNITQFCDILNSLEIQPKFRWSSRNWCCVFNDASSCGRNVFRIHGSANACHGHAMGGEIRQINIPYELYLVQLFFVFSVLLIVGCDRFINGSNLVISWYYQDISHHIDSLLLVNCALYLSLMACNYKD
jgi:hypothetical protein